MVAPEIFYEGGNIGVVLRAGEDDLAEGGASADVARDDRLVVQRKLREVEARGCDDGSERVLRDAS